jgi:hypothetical protein
MKKQIGIFALILVVSCGAEESSIIDIPNENLINQPDETFNFTPPEDILAVDSTTDLDTSIVLTENHESGINEVVQHYGGSCTQTFGFQKEGLYKGRYFEVEIKDSETLESYIEVPEIPSSTMAYLFYNKLGPDQANLEFIRASISFNDNKKSTSEYSVYDLKLVEQKLAVIDQLNERIGNSDYTNVKSMLSAELYDFPKDEFVANMDTVGLLCGKPTGIDLYSFQFYELSDSEQQDATTSKSNQRILHISYTMLREKQSHECSVEFYADPTRNEIVDIKYRY